MNKKVYFIFLPLLILLFTNCGPTLVLQSLENMPPVQTQKVQKTDIDSLYELAGKKYSFPERVERVQYMPQWQLMSINLKTSDRKGAYAIYDVATETINWANKGNYDLALLQREVAMVSNQDKRMLLNAQNGKAIRRVDGEDFVVIDDSITLRLQDRFSKINLTTGQTSWFRQGESRYEGWMSDELDGDWMYVVANGLHGFDLNTGKGWYYAANTDYDATRGGRAAVNTLMVGLNILSLFAGGYGDEFPYMQKKKAHNVFSKPKIAKNQLYFADRKEIICLEKKTGKVQWTKKVSEELGVSDLKIVASNRLLIIGKGYRYVNYVPDKDRPAMLYMLDMTDGQILSQTKLPKKEIITDYASNDAFIYAFTTKKVYQFDRALTQLKTINLPRQYGAPLRVIAWSSSEYDAYLQTEEPDYPLVIRTVQGVLALHPITLEELWFQRLGTPLRDMPSLTNEDKWQLPLYINEIDVRRSWTDETMDVFWFAKAGKIIGLDLLDNGAILGEFELPSDDFWYIGNGELLQFGGRAIQLLRLQTRGN